MSFSTVVLQLIDGLEIDLVVYPKNYNFTPINKYSIDPKYLTARCGCEVLELDTDVVASTYELFDTKVAPKRAAEAVSA